jgi:hypothetical protein
MSQCSNALKRVARQIAGTTPGSPLTPFDGVFTQTLTSGFLRSTPLDPARV